MSIYKHPLFEVPDIKDLRELLQLAARTYGDKHVFLTRETPQAPYVGITYRRFFDDVQAFGAALMDLGLKDKKIAVIGQHSYEWSVAYMTVVCGLGIVVPIDKDLPLQELVLCMQRANVAAVIFSGSKRKDILAVWEDIKAHTHCCIDMQATEDREDCLAFHKLLQHGHELWQAGKRDFAGLKIDPDAFGILLFTSGTSADSKAVMLSHTNIVSNIKNTCRLIMFYPEDVFLSVLPIHHTYQCTCGFLLPMMRGATIAFCHDFSQFAQSLAASKTTILLGVPLIFEAIHNRIYQQAHNTGKIKLLRRMIRFNNVMRRLGLNLSGKLFAQIHKNFGGNLRLFVSGAAGIDPKVSKALRNVGFNIIQGYGLTECSPILALNRLNYYRDRAAGLPLPGLELKIMNPNSDGIGEIAAKGPNVMVGYYEQAEETAESFTEDGFFLTGDLGYLDADNFLYITGRKKNVIVLKNGKTVFPEELEELLHRSPYISECMVYAKHREDDGEFDSDDNVLIAVSILPDMDYIRNKIGFMDTLSTDNIMLLLENEVDLVNRSVSKYKQIRFIHVRQKEFAKSSTRKIKRYMEQPE